MHRREVLENHTTFMLVRHHGRGTAGRALGQVEDHTLKVCTVFGEELSICTSPSCHRPWSRGGQATIHRSGGEEEHKGPHL